MDKEPTEAQVKEFWEWCGFKWEAIPDSCMQRKRPVEGWLYPQGIYMRKTPPLDLNNLGKYAVPKLYAEGYNYKLWSDDGYHFAQIFPIDNHEDIVGASIVGELEAKDALYRAIVSFWEVIHDKPSD